MGIPVNEASKYNGELSGFFGEFGGGNNARISYIQTGLKSSDLDILKLVSEIQGTEKWPVRDLFQREVDMERVENRLMPYLKDPHTTKFFNPITLTILRVDDNEKNKGQRCLPKLNKYVEKEGDYDWEVLELKDYFQFRYVVGSPQFGNFKWNREKIEIVAVDGQHRLSALQRMKKEDTFEKDWVIPAVLFAPSAENDKGSKETFLSLVRKIFININTLAQRVSNTRQILLNEDRIHNFMTQELLQLFHSNDLSFQEDSLSYDEKMLPLISVDWKGLERDGDAIGSPGALFSVVEINVWMQEYFSKCKNDLDNFTDGQKNLLKVKPGDGDLAKSFFSKPSVWVSEEGSSLARERMNSDLIPAINFLLSYFTPVKSYISELRKLEAGYLNKSDLTKIAMNDLRFGSHTSHQCEKDIVILKGEIQDDLELELRKFPLFLTDDIFWRGIMSSFYDLKEEVWNHVSASGENTWRAYAEWYVECLNKAWEDRCFTETRLEKFTPKMTQGGLLAQLPVELRFIAIGNDGNVGGYYRPETVRTHFGQYVGLLVGSYGGHIFSADEFEEFKSRKIEKLFNAWKTGYTRFSKTIIRNKEPDISNLDLTKKSRVQGEKEAKKILQKLDKRIEDILKDV